MFRSIYVALRWALIGADCVPGKRQQIDLKSLEIKLTLPIKAGSQAEDTLKQRYSKQLTHG